MSAPTSYYLCTELLLRLWCIFEVTFSAIVGEALSVEAFLKEDKSISKLRWSLLYFRKKKKSLASWINDILEKCCLVYLLCRCETWVLFYTEIYWVCFRRHLFQNSSFTRVETNVQNRLCHLNGIKTHLFQPASAEDKTWGSLRLPQLENGNIHRNQTDERDHFYSSV